MGESEERYRLPRTVVPSRYDLTLEPDLDAGTFDGTIEVALQILEPVTEIVLNANELKLDSATLTAADGRAVEAAKILTDDDAERATFPLAEAADAEPAVRQSAPARATAMARLRGGRMLVLIGMTRISLKVWFESATELSRFETSGFASPPRDGFAFIDYLLKGMSGLWDPSLKRVRVVWTPVGPDARPTS